MIWTVWFQVSTGMSPMPLAEGQMSGLISFIIHAWWPAPSVDPASVTYWTQSAGWSRQYCQPWNDAARNLTAMSSLPGWASHAARAQRASWSIAVLMLGSLKSMMLKSLGWYRLPVAGFLASSNCAYSL